MTIIKTDDIFVVVSTFYGVDTDTSNLFTSKEDAEKWRTDTKNISLEYQNNYKVMTLMDWIYLLKNDAYDNGRRDGSDMKNN